MTDVPEVNSMRDVAAPYAGTIGYAGSDTSRIRAESEVADGTASKRQRFILILAWRAGEHGITVAELRDSNLHHGRVSGALSVLHKVGKLARLTESRGRCKVYVLPEHVNGRPTEVHGVVHKADKETIAAAETVESWVRRHEDSDAMFDIDPEDEPLAAAMLRLVNYAKGRAL
jgi:hypothetical protein